jgi:hypothetical protein
LMCAPFVQLAPTFRALWGRLQEGAIGTVHSARGLYGNAGSTWSRWYHDGSIGPLAEVGIYNLKSLTAVLGPVAAVQAPKLSFCPTGDFWRDRQNGGFRRFTRPLRACGWRFLPWFPVIAFSATGVRGSNSTAPKGLPTSWG